MQNRTGVGDTWIEVGDTWSSYQRSRQLGQRRVSPLIFVCHDREWSRLLARRPGCAGFRTAGT